MPYLLYLPSAYPSGSRWPLLMFLHGSGERGDELALLTQRGIPKLLAQGLELPFIVVSPQCPANTIWSQHLDALMVLLDNVAARYAIDAQRVYLTGMSMGGSGTWHLAVSHPESFAAIAPVCGDRVWYAGEPSQVCAIRDVPVWAFHGANDKVIPATASQELVQALRTCGGSPRLTVYPGVGHNCWNQAYESTELYDWLLEQRRR